MVGVVGNGGDVVVADRHPRPAAPFTERDRTLTAQFSPHRERIVDVALIENVQIPRPILGRSEHGVRVAAVGESI